jgi:hypothetical protein
MENQKIRENIKAAYDDSKQRYGAVKIQRKLNAMSIPYSI